MCITLSDQSQLITDHYEISYIHCTGYRKGHLSRKANKNIAACNWYNLLCQKYPTIAVFVCKIRLKNNNSSNSAAKA